MPKIAVCVKQVPEDKTMVQHEDGNLNRSGMHGCINMYDIAALETAIQIKEDFGGSVDVFTMGPVQAEHVLRETLAYGADKAILLCDVAFAGADVLATSYTLATAIQYMDDYDIVLCGLKTTDGDTAQMGGELAKQLGILYVPNVCAVKEYDAENGLYICFETDEKLYDVKVDTPAVLTIVPALSKSRMPTLAQRLKSRKKQIITLGCTDFPIDCMRTGRNGSATKVVNLFHTQKDRKSELLYLDANETLNYIEDRKKLWIK